MHCIAAIDDYPDKLGGLTRCKHPIIELMLDHNFARRFSAPGSNIGSRPTIIVLLFGQFPGVGANASLQEYVLTPTLFHEPVSTRPASSRPSGLGLTIPQHPLLFCFSFSLFPLHLGLGSGTRGRGARMKILAAVSR